MGATRKVEAEVGGDIAAAVAEAVASGDYGSPDEVVRAALRAWRDRREARAAEIARLRALWEEGLASGPGEGLSVEDIKAMGRARLAGAG
jgi:antitoxin ParD1/3/4